MCTALERAPRSREETVVPKGHCCVKMETITVERVTQTGRQSVCAGHSEGEPAQEIRENKSNNFYPHSQLIKD